MGAGKTTTAQFLTRRLQQSGAAARFLAEGPTIEESEHPLRVATTLAHPNAVWRDVKPAQFIARSLRIWRDFASAAQQAESGAVTVCDGLLFHGNLTDLLLMDVEPYGLAKYVADVLGTIRALKPVVISLRWQDVAAALREICAERGGTWEAYQVMSPMATARGLQLPRNDNGAASGCMTAARQSPNPAACAASDAPGASHGEHVTTCHRRAE
jgi:hypothetical protein